MDVQLKTVGGNRSADQIIRVKTPVKHLSIAVESAKASLIKDAGMVGSVVALYAVLSMVGAPVGFVWGVVVTLFAILVPIILFKSSGRWRSMEPDEAIEFIAMEIEDAVSQSKERRDLI